MSKNLKHDSLSKKVLLSVLAAGVMSTCVMGSALARDVQNNDLAQAYGIVVTTNSSFENVMNNTATAGNQKDGLAGGGIYIFTAPTVTFNNSIISENKLISTGGGKNSTAYGGAVSIKGSKVIFNDAVFTDNVVEVKDTQLAVGGAISADARRSGSIDEAAHLEFNSTKDAKYTGNTIKTQDGYNSWNDTYGGLTTSSGGFLFLDRNTDVVFYTTNGSTITIGEVNSTDVNADTISSSLIHNPDIKAAAIKKTGDGTLTINSSLDKYYGTLEVTEGTVNFNQDLNLRNNYKVTGGTVNLGNVTLNKLSDTIQGAKKSDDGTFTLVGKTAADVSQTKTYTLTDFTGSITTAKGSTLTAKNIVVNAGSVTADGTVNAKNIVLNAGSVKAEGTVNAEHIEVRNSAQVVLNGGGKVTGQKVKHIDVEDDRVDSADEAFVSDGSVSKDGLFLKANSVDFTGEVRVDNGGKIVLSGGSITSGQFYDKEGKAIVGYTTEIGAHGSGSDISLTRVAINSNLGAFNGGKINVYSSNVNASSAIFANNGGNISLYDDTGNAKYNVEDYGIEANNGGVIRIAGGDLVTTKLIADSRTDGHVCSNIIADSRTDENACSNIIIEGQDKNTYTVKEAILATQGGKISILGGVLQENALRSKMYNIKDEETGKILNTDNGGIVLAENGVISTMSDQIYANAASATQKEAGEVTNEGIDFQGGTLSLNDAEYTLAYAKDAGTKVGPTKIVMTGKLAGAVDDTIKVADAATVGSDVALDKVTAETEGSLLVGSEAAGTSTNVEGIEVKDKVKNGFAVASLNLGQDAKGVVITNDKEVTLGGSQGGSLITVAGAEKTVKVVVGTNTDVTGASSKAGTLNIGNSLATSDTNYKLNGEVVVNDGSKLNVKGQTEITEALTLNGANVDATQGKLTTDKLAVAKDSALKGEVKATSLKGADDTTLAIGDKDNAGKLTVEKAELNGATLFLDPAWKDGATIGDASGFAVTDVSSALDGAYVAGQNSKLAFGADLAAAEAKFAKTGYTWGDGDEEISAAAYIAKSVDLGTAGSITVDGSRTMAPTATAREVTFAKNSMLIVDAAQTKTEAAIKNVNNVAIGDSVLYIDEAKKGETYHILAGTADGWDDEAIDSNNSLLKFEQDTSVADEYAVTASTASVKDVFEGQVIAPNAYDATLNAKTDGDAAYDFIMAAADSKVNGGYDGQVSALNSAAAMSELAGVEHGTYAASNLLTDAVADHMSLANAKDHNSDIWAKYIHTKEDVDGLSIANFGADYDAQYNGIVVGADLYKNGKTTVGAALTYVDGNINGNTLAARTKNDATYYGASIYGGIQSEDSAVIGDISYLHGKNDITQYNSGKTLTADAKSDAFSIGVRAEKSVKAGVGKFVPYAGLRYMHLGTGNYTNSIGMSYDGDDMNLWLLPVGVKYSADVKTGSWTIRPIAEVGYVWNMGDRDATQTVSLNGASDGFGYDVTDSGSYIGRFMIEAEKANVTYGLGYEYQKGDSVKANRWMANLNWSF